MKSELHKQSISELTRLLGLYLEMPEEKVFIKESAIGTGSYYMIKAGDYTFLAEYKGTSARAHLHLAVARFEERSRSSKQNVIPLLVVPYMGESGRRFCKEHELAWIDLSGNAHIKAPGILIDIEGKPNRFKRIGRPSNLFAPKSSRIVRQLLLEPDRGFTQRELSKATGLDEGYTSRIVRRLEEIGLLVRDDKSFLRPEDPHQLLEAWREVYDFEKHNIIRGHIAARSGKEMIHRIADILSEQQIEFTATGLCAAWLYTYFISFRIGTFYISNPPGKELSALLGFRGEERGANTWLVVPNDEGVYQGEQVLDGIRCVHPVQVYLDLKAHPERSSEAAAILHQEYLNWRQDA